MSWGQLGTKVWQLGFVTLLILGLLGGCAKKEIKVAGEGATLPTEQIASAAAGEGEADESAIGEGAISGGAYGSGAISEGRTSGPMLPIYFDFDKYSIREDMKGRMEANARFLLENPAVRIEVQGNCDDRGSAEYNLALGEKRAKSAKAYLVNLGVSPDRIEIVSFGEEKPLNPAHNEEAWAQNRRDDFVIIK